MFENEEQEGSKKRRTWVKDIFKGRMVLGQFHTLYKEMRSADRESFFRLV